MSNPAPSFKTIADVQSFSDQAMSIIVAAKLLKVTTRTLRRYDAEGKLKARRTLTNEIYYLPQDLEPFYRLEKNA